jgi:ribosomal protein S18 acetylase RimI-like enzyme
MITVRPDMAEDRPALLRLLTELQSHLASLDPQNRLQTADEFDAETYIDHLFSTLEQNNGSFFVAEEKGTVLGFIAGSIPKEDPEDLLDHYPAKEGKILELVVSESYREKGIGRLLMEKMEEELRRQGCEYIRVGCFAPNTGTHAFYKKCGYDDRYIEMLKRL